ncbi:MAG: hypothetical protein SXV54_25010, partial [Chloroflexota bacterium]|nr:hypothetical protein [Chloroflexota bacterium]
MSQGYAYLEGVRSKPGIVTAISAMTLISGILNVLWTFGLAASTVMGTFGIGILCAPLTILPLVLGIFEIIYATRLLSDPPRPTRPSPVIAILEICCILFGNVTSLVIGILALVFYNQPDVQG